MIPIKLIKLIVKLMKLIVKSMKLRQHVCDLLESGDIAFKQRENKYEELE